MTKDGAGVPTEVARAVAENVRRIRQLRGWSLETLAQRSGISKGVLVAMEQERGNPSLATLCRLGDAFALPLTDLVSRASEPAVRVANITDGTLLWSADGGGTGHLVLSSDPPTPVEYWRWRMAPGQRHESEAHAVGTREIAHVDEGVLTLVLAGTDTEVAAGQVATFPTDRPHAYANQGTGPVTFNLVVMVPERGE